jgi:signal transduction histidine kinase
VQIQQRRDGASSGKWRRRAFDAAIALGSAFLSLAILTTIDHGVDASVEVTVVVLALIHTLCLFWRRIAPWPVLATNLASGIAIVVLGFPMVVLQLAPLLAIYAVSSQVPRPSAAWACVAGIGGLALGEFLGRSTEDLGTIVGNLVAIFAAWVMGTFVFSRQEYVRQLEDRTKELQEAREELAERAVADERLRIARELHDVVAHSLSIIAVRAGVGAHVLDTNPEEARTALKTTEQVSRKALDEMRRLLGVLRDGTAPSLSPLPGLSELSDLVEGVSSTGPAVDLRINGDPIPLSAGLELTAYRIVQESLTNVVKHAHASKARVAVTFHPTELVVEVVDDGAAVVSSNGTNGHGLEGMRERAELFGGTFEAGPLQDGGFRVRAAMPLEAASS